MYSFPESKSSDSSSSSVDDNNDILMARIRAQIADPDVSSCDKKRYRAIANDAIQNMGNELACAFVLLLVCASGVSAHQGTANSEEARTGVPTCLNHPDRNGARPGCGH